MCLLDNFFVNKASLSCMLSMNDNKQYRLYISYKIGNVIAFLLWCNDLCMRKQVSLHQIVQINN